MQLKGEVMKSKELIMWVNHFSLLPGDPSVKTHFNAVNSGVGGGLTGLVIHSSTTGDEAHGGGNKVVQKALDIPPGFQITGVRVGYENSNARSYITQVRLAQVQTPPGTALVLLDDPTHLNAAGPTYANSAATSINPASGPLLLDLRVNFADTSDRIVVRGLGLLLLEQ
jgi:hypothetical protein